MRYAYHFEFCERPELPEWFRGDLFLSLAWVQEAFGLREVLERVVPELVKASGARQLVELGSGSGDGLARIARVLPSGFPVLATDKYPHFDLWQQKLGHIHNASWTNAQVGFEDFDRVLGLEILEGSVVLLTTAFHHVPKREAVAFLRRCANARAHVLVVEPLERTIAGVVLGALSGLPTIIAPLVARGVPLWRRLRLALFHSVVPLIPLFIAHDGVVSALRQRTHGDWRELVKVLPYRLVVRDRLGLFANFSVVLLKYENC